MYRFYINNVDNDYHYGELARVFLNEDEFEVIALRMSDSADLKLRPGSYLINAVGADERDVVKREFYQLLKELTGSESDWGTLTGVRPLKLALDILDKNRSISGMQERLRIDYLVSQEKIDLLTDIIEYQISHVSGNPSDSIAIYVGIPFCPTRCAYCSFASNVASDEVIEKYLQDLIKEINYMGALTCDNRSRIESIYIGGGTPTTLTEDQLERLIISIRDSFNININDIEFTIEAGRPDTITDKKLSVMKNLGISRISINPQTMKNTTLRLNNSSQNRATDL